MIPHKRGGRRRQLHRLRAARHAAAVLPALLPFALPQARLAVAPRVMEGVVRHEQREAPSIAELAWRPSGLPGAMLRHAMPRYATVHYAPQCHAML